MIHLSRRWLVTSALVVAGLAPGPAVALASPSPLAVVVPGLGAPMPVPAGRVSVVLGALTYRVGDVIHITVENGLSRTIYAEDMKSDCSIVILEQWTGTDWRIIEGCAMGRAPVTVAVGPMRGRTVTLNPLSPHLLMGRPRTAGPVLGAGRYRVKFTYRFDPGAEADEPHAAYSPLFSIRS